MTFVGMPLLVVVAVGATCAAAVLILYLLKSTPRPQPVSNVDFWLKAAEQAKPSWMFSTRIPFWALLLTLLVALLLVVLSGDPKLDEGLGGTTIVVLDAGRGMNARHDDGTRMERAIELLEDTAARATVTGRILVIRAGIRPSVMVPLTNSTGELDRAVEEHSPDDGPSDLNAACSLADRLAARVAEPRRIILISDRDIERPRPGTSVDLISVGRAGETVAIVTFGARRDPIALGEYITLCEVEAYTEHPARARLLIEDGDVVVADEEIRLEPGERVSHRARGFTRHAGELTARLTDIEIDSGTDVLTTDNFAYAALPPLSRTRVLLVTSGNRYLRSALELDPSVEVDEITPDELESNAWSNETLWSYHVLILDRFHASRPIPHAGVMLVDPPERAPDLHLGREVEDLQVTSVSSTHPVLEAVEIDDMSIESARILLPDPDDRVLMRAERHALAIARDVRGERRVVLGFDLHSTDLVRQVAFPLLMHNTIVWLTNEQAPARSASPPGQPLAFAGARAQIEMPGDETSEGRAGSFHDTAASGFYRVNDRPFAVSAVDHAGPVVAAPIQPTYRGRSGWPELGLMLGLALLLLIVAEWILLHRGYV